jgi:hypothetical protein
MSYIPEVVLPQKEVDDIEVREYPDDIDDSVELQQLEEQGFGEEQGVEEDIEPLPPPPQKKEKLKKEDIFKPKQPPPKKVGIDPKPNLEEPIVPKIEPVKKKRQLSDAQKAALAKGREKRAANKKQATAPSQPRSEGSYAEPVYEPPAEAVAYKQKKMNEDYNRQHPINNGLSQEEIQEMIFQGVQKYDAIRKVRKEKKRKEQARQQHENKVFGDLNSQLRVNDPWAAAFNF